MHSQGSKQCMQAVAEGMTAALHLATSCLKTFLIQAVVGGLQCGLQHCTVRNMNTIDTLGTILYTVTIVITTLRAATAYMYRAY